MTKFHRNFIDVLTDHEKRIDRLDARWKATLVATGKAPPECQKLHVFHTDQSVMNISHNPPTVQSLVIPAYPYTRVLYLPLPLPDVWAYIAIVVQKVG